MYILRPMETPKNPTPIEHRIQEGLERLAVVMRADQWNAAKASAVNPTQRSILEYLENRSDGAGLTEIAIHFAVSQPTATDSVAALERKGFVERRTSETDRRSVKVILTEAGRTLLAEGHGEGRVRIALDRLGTKDKSELLVTVIKLIKTLQDLDAIPVQRMCANCRYFAPFIHPDGEKPHHCNYVDAAFGQRDVRIDCREHETADPASRAATWEAFQRG
ncbi:MarR family transcriptional regulator protein [Rhizobium etli bv. phaseoli str. IE4803]|nr:MarR family transcriptional regulator protein [Rhizobium etli bv. phaseoli str. IE4803]